MPTVLELVTEVRDIIDEPTAAQWSDAQLKKWIDEGNRDIARLSHHYKSTDILTLTMDVSEYTLPADILAIEHVYYDDLAGTKMPLVARHYEQMDGIWGGRQDWGGLWPSYFTTWGHQPTLKLIIWPVPQVTGHLAHLLMSITPAPMQSLSDSSQVEVPGAWYDMLADYCSYKALLRDGNPAMDRFLAAYTGKRDALLHNNEYLNVAREMVPDPVSRFGYVPAWLAEW
jgi:hypothetical protein